MGDTKIVQLYLNKDETAISESKTKYGNKLLQISYNIINNFLLFKRNIGTV